MTRVFVLCTGRCGSMTLSKALAHATNYTCAHESRSGRAADRLDYPDDHIEVDNRLSFFTGMLYERYPDAFYIHLWRSRDAVVESYTRRFQTLAGIMRAYANGILQNTRRPDNHKQRQRIAGLYVDATEANIDLFLGNTNVRRGFINMSGNPAADLSHIWHQIGAVGNLGAAQAELLETYNASKGRR